MISIAFIIGSFRRGGAERDLLELLRRLDRSRYDMHVLYAERDGDMLKDFEATGVPMIPLGFDSLLSIAGLRGVRRMREYLRRHHVRILQGFGVYGSFYGAIIGAPLAGVSLVSYEFTAIEQPSLKVRMFQPYYYRRSRVVLGNSDAVLQAVAARRGIQGRQLLKIHNGVDVAAFSSGNSQAPAEIEGVAPGDLVVGAVGRLHPIKGHRYLVSAWPKVSAKFPGAKLVLVGPAWPHQRQAIEDVARRAGVEKGLILTGLREDVPRLLGRMDVVAVPSLTEGFSNVIIEAGAAGRPVIATRVGGNPEAVVEGVTGLLVPPEDPDALAAAIIELLSDPDRRRAMGEAARARVAALYTVERMVSSYDRLYSSLQNPES